MAATDTNVKANVQANASTTPEVKKSDTVTCDIFNPTKARRTIYDGIPGSMKQISIPSGATKQGVTLSRLIAEEMRDRNRTKKNSDLVVSPA